MDEELAEAKENNDPGAVDSLTAERDGLLKEVSPGLRTRGGLRPLGPPDNASKAADAVRNALRRAYKMMKQSMPGLVDHLKLHIRKEGTTLAYRPPTPTPHWAL